MFCIILMKLYVTFCINSLTQLIKNYLEKKLGDEHDWVKIFLIP